MKIIPATRYFATATIMGKGGAKSQIIWEITFEQERGEALNKMYNPRYCAADVTS